MPLPLPFRAVRARSHARRQISPRSGLTERPRGARAREFETLEEIGKGLSNRIIAAKLGITAKTVDHHVSAVLAKLGAKSRREAASIAQQQPQAVQDREGSGVE